MMTPRQHEVPAYLSHYVDSHGFAPSYEEIAAALHMRSKSGVYHIMRQLEDRALIRRLPRRARAIEIIRRPAKPKGAH